MLMYTLKNLGIFGAINRRKRNNTRKTKKIRRFPSFNNKVYIGIIK